jgi:hypothetical protein
MKCPRCQQENPTQAKFCLECGMSVTGAAPISGSYADLKGEIEGLRRTLGVSLCLLALICAERTRQTGRFQSSSAPKVPPSPRGQ